MPPAPAEPRTGAAAPAPARAAAQPEEPRGTPRAAGSPEIGARPSDVFAEDWWTHARPTFEVHGYYRLRAELFHQFAIGRIDDPADQIWPQPPDKQYVDLNNQLRRVQLCGDDPAALEACDNNTNAGANMRFRLNPELHVSDNLRVLSQIDLLDNLVLGSTPEGYTGAGFDNTGEARIYRTSRYAQVGALSSTQWAPTSSVVVKRVWGEYLTPVGLLRFGRMPHHWGLGMVYNSGDGYDSDYQTTVDRLMLVTGIKKYDLYFSAAWDFANEGAISGTTPDAHAQAYDQGEEDDVNQYTFVAVRRKNPELQKLEIARGNVVMNGGLHLAYRTQTIANEDPRLEVGAIPGQAPVDLQQGYTRRGAEIFTPDLWFQLLYKKFRFEMEAAMIWGSIENTGITGGVGSNYQNPVDDSDDDGWNLRQFGLSTQSEFRAIEDRLRIHFGFGYATGDDDEGSLLPQGTGGLSPQLTSNRTYSTFRFHPDYRVDMILFRHVLQRVQGAYYFRPGVDYDFARDKNGQRLGGGAAVVWSRASEFVQTPGHARDLGLELNAQLYFQSKDGTLNDDPDKMGGFYTSLQYGVMFPLGGLGYLPGQESAYENLTGATDLDTETAQTLRWYLGVLF